MPILTAAVRIAASFISRSSLPVSETPELIRQIHGVLVDLMESSLASAPAATRNLSETRLEPMVESIAVPSKAPPRQIVTQDAVICLICGQSCKVMRGHLSKTHEMTLAVYRRQFNLDREIPLVAPNYSEKRRQLAAQFRLARAAPSPVTEPVVAPEPVATPKRRRRSAT
ncbi:MAG: MucR family transcriptional regulator [Magnetococcales bacterium]|nr:MucR family transcriptional regulator [Magnetococcales bacterium]